MRSWQEMGYETVWTKDGSPSLKAAATADAEMMHHRGGAMTESRLIYGRLIQAVFRGGRAARFLSLGLGLGYNEALIAEGAGAGAATWSCVSYESDPQLIESFLGFLQEKPQTEDVRSTYQKIFAGLKNSEGVRRELLKAWQERRWVISGPLGFDTAPPFSVHAFLWDAFSQKTSPELWEEGFLTGFLKNHADPEMAGFTTYACIGKLKRALKANGFHVQVLEGFHGKQNSTLAWRGSGWDFQGDVLFSP